MSLHMRLLAAAGPGRSPCYLARVARVVAVALALVAFFWQAARYPAVPNSDDAYISFRYADNLAHGRGLVFNPGERVEGYSNLLWVVALAGLHRLAADTPTTAYVLSLLFGAVTIVLVALWPARLAPLLARRAREPGAPRLEHADVAVWGGASALLLGCSHALAFAAVQGLETTLMAALVSVALLALDPGTGRPGWVSATAFALAMLTRPEGVLLFLVVAAAFAVSPGAPSRWARARALMPCAAALVAYGCVAAWRVWYYGALVPNTYFAKRADLGGDLVSGLRYVGDWIVGGSGAIVALACVAIALVLGWRVLGAWPFVLLGVHAAAVVTTGGDFFALGRFFVPLAPLAAVFSALACLLLPALLLRPATTRRGWPWTVRGVALLAACVALALPGLRQAGGAAAEYAELTGKWVHLGKVVRDTFPAGTTIALSPVGAIPYFSGLPTLDILGLTDAHIARMPADPGITRKGHQKHDGAYILSRRPDVLLLGNGVIVSRDGTRPGGLWCWPHAGYDSAGRFSSGPRLDWWRDGWLLVYEADIEASPEFARAYRPALLPLQDGFELLYWRRISEAAPWRPASLRATRTVP
jgi:hypothetical protein